MDFECPIPRSRDPDVADDGKRTSLWSWSLFLAQLHALWRSLLDRVRRHVGSPSTPAGTLMDGMKSGHCGDPSPLPPSAQVGRRTRPFALPFLHPARIRGRASACVAFMYRSDIDNHGFLRECTLRGERGCRYAARSRPNGCAATRGTFTGRT